MKARLACLLLLLTAFGLPGSVLVGAPAALGANDVALERLLLKEMAARKMPGLRAAVRFPDGRVEVAAVGLADKKTNEPLDTTVGMPGGSTGKTFVAALTLLLVEDGTLSLDDPVSQWLGHTEWFGDLPNAESMRVRHLLSHTAGLKDYPETMRFHTAMIGRVIRRGSAKFTPEELIGFVSKRRPLFAPGQGFHYSDPGYLVLGRLLEEAGGKDYYELLQERILGPLALDQIVPQDRSILPGVPVGYSGGARNMKKDGRMKFDPSSEFTGGGVVVNPTMLVEFYAAPAEHRLLEPASFDQMVNSGWRSPADREWHYGFGVFVDADGEWFSHGGLWPGYRTHVAHQLDRGVTVAVQTNRDGRVDLEGLVAQIFASVEVD